MTTATAKAASHAKAYSYLRFSSGEQRFGDSERRQLADAEAMALANGWTIDESFRLADRGVSAFHGANAAEGGELAKFLAAVEAGTVSVQQRIDLAKIGRPKPTRKFSIRHREHRP